MALIDMAYHEMSQLFSCHFRLRMRPDVFFGGREVSPTTREGRRSRPVESGG